MGGSTKIAFLAFTMQIVYSCVDYSTGLSTYKELRTIDNIIIVDSITSTYGKVYWYCVDFGIRGYSSGRVGLAKNKFELVEDEKLIAISDGITDIGLVNDTLELYLLDGHSIIEKDIEGSKIHYLKVIPDDNHQGLIINRIEGNTKFPTQEVEIVNQQR